MTQQEIAKKLSNSAKKLAKKLNQFTFSEPISFVYNPLDYAFSSHHSYLHRYGNSQKKTLFLGMNPGPFGMAQTGIPFGEIHSVRQWLRIEEAIKKPPKEHPKRPILGFAIQKSEISGKRLWGLFQKQFQSAEEFFTQHFVINFCPLIWLSKEGRNITPDKINKSQVTEIFALCQEHLQEIIETFQAKNLIGIGNFAEKQLQIALHQMKNKKNLKITKILHPSPASPAANRNWEKDTIHRLTEEKIW